MYNQFYFFLPPPLQVTCCIALEGEKGWGAQVATTAEPVPKDKYQTLKERPTQLRDNGARARS